MPIRSVSLPAGAPACTDPLICVTGTLLSDAEWRVTGGQVPAGFLRVLLEQRPGLYPISACQLVGTDLMRMQAGAAKARVLRRGAKVRVYGTGLFNHGDRVIELTGITDILPLNPPQAPALTSRGGDAA